LEGGAVTSARPGIGSCHEYVIEARLPGPFFVWPPFTVPYEIRATALGNAAQMRQILEKTSK
jgi:hypothetical protein